MLNYKKIVLNKVGINDNNNDNNNDNKMIWYDIWYDIMIYKYNYLYDISKTKTIYNNLYGYCKN